jgi:hypothetical protein
VPELISRLPESPEHLDRCWLEPEQKRTLRNVNGQIGLAAPTPPPATTPPVSA